MSWVWLLEESEEEESSESEPVSLSLSLLSEEAEAAGLEAGITKPGVGNLVVSPAELASLFSLLSLLSLSLLPKAEPEPNADPDPKAPEPKAPEPKAPEPKPAGAAKEVLAGAGAEAEAEVSLEGWISLEESLGTVPKGEDEAGVDPKGAALETPKAEEEGKAGRVPKGLVLVLGVLSLLASEEEGVEVGLARKIEEEAVGTGAEETGDESESEPEDGSGSAKEMVEWVIF